MATFIEIVVTIIIISIVFGLYACIVIGNESKTEKEQLYENDEQIKYINKCYEAKKQRKQHRKRNYKDKKSKDVIDL